MWKELDERALCCAEYIVQTRCTVRACAAHFSVSKSTVHKDMTERLPLIDKVLYSEVRGILLTNLKERHLRGGDATRKKYEMKRRAASFRFKKSTESADGLSNNGMLYRNFPQKNSAASVTEVDT